MTFVNLKYSWSIFRKCTAKRQKVKIAVNQNTGEDHGLSSKSCDFRIHLIH